MQSSDEEKQFKRLPAKETTLSELTGTEKRVSVIGTIVSIDDSALKAVLSDGSTEAVLEFSDNELFSKAGQESIVRVIGRPNSGERVSISVEAIHELKDFDRELFEQVRQIEKKVLK